MKASCTAILILLTAALQAVAAEGRIRIENTGGDGRVVIVVGDEDVHSVEISIPGVVSGEMVTVEAPAPQVRLTGGSLEGDLLLEAMIQEKLRASSPRTATVLVIPAPDPVRIEPRRALNQVFTDVGFALEPGWISYGAYPQDRTNEPRCDSRPRRTTHDRPSFSPRPARSSQSARAMMPRR